MLGTQWSAQIFTDLESRVSLISFESLWTSRPAYLNICRSSVSWRSRWPSVLKGALSGSSKLSSTKMNAPGPLLLVDRTLLQSKNLEAVLRKATSSALSRYPVHHLRKIPV